MLHTMIPALLLALTPQEPDVAKLVSEARLSMAQAVEIGLREAKDGAVVQAELEFEKNRTVWSLDIARGKKVLELLLDARDGSLIERAEENEDCSAVVSAARTTLIEAVAAVRKQHKGTAVLAQMKMAEGKPSVSVDVFRDGKKTSFVVDVVGGQEPGKGKATGNKPQQQGSNKEQAEEEEEEGEEGEEAAEHEGKAGAAKAAHPTAQSPDNRFTDTFGEQDRDLGPTGRNAFFVLEPGYTLVLVGKDGDQVAQNTITVLPETKNIAGIEARVVEEKETVGGVVKEITRDYFAISKRTNNVYYLGEDVDVYENGVVTSHEGAWLHGENGAHYGLMMPAAPLLGARFQQETAPKVAMDRAEIESLSGTFECPAGRFEQVLVVVETTPLEKGAEQKLYARGVGLLRDGDLHLERYGFVGAK